jgi:hypothetical protein
MVIKANAPNRRMNFLCTSYLPYKVFRYPPGRGRWFARRGARGPGGLAGTDIPMLSGARLESLPADIKTCAGQGACGRVGDRPYREALRKLRQPPAQLLSLELAVWRL